MPSETGIAISVVQNGDIVFTGTYGLRERDRHLPVTSQTLFEIGSLTKAFTVSALLHASEQGRLDLNRPINSSHDLLPMKDPETSQKISILDILSHRTGLPANDLRWYLGPKENETIRQAIQNLDGVPGAFRQSFIYNNLMYGALGQLFGDFVGQDWESAVTQNILSPLQMSSTRCRLKGDESDIALPYINTRRVQNADMSAVTAAGAIRSNIEDMGRWLAFHLEKGKSLSGERVLSETSIEQMQEKQIAVEHANPLIFQGLEWLEESRSYGMGWFLGQTRGMKAVYHPGFIDGFSVALVMIPERRLGFVAMVNENFSTFPGLVIQNLLEYILNPIEETPSQNPPHKAEGSYENSAYGVVSIRDNGTVFEYNGHALPLTWKTETSGEMGISVSGLQFPLPVELTVRDGKVEQLTIPMGLDPRVSPQVFTRI